MERFDLSDELVDFVFVRFLFFCRIEVPFILIIFNDCETQVAALDKHLVHFPGVKICDLLFSHLPGILLQLGQDRIFRLDDLRGQRCCGIDLILYFLDKKCHLLVFQGHLERDRIGGRIQHEFFRFLICLRFGYKLFGF